MSEPGRVDPCLPESRARVGGGQLPCLAAGTSLIRAIDLGLDFAFETTLGGRTMTDLLTRAARRTCEADPRLGTAPAPRLLLAMRDGRIIDSVAVDEVPDWARPVVMAAVEL